jgi:molecular chaperone DnaK
VDAAMTELNQAWTAASEELYKAQQAAGGAQPQENGQNENGSAEGSQPGSENVTDAEFEEVK